LSHDLLWWSIQGATIDKTYSVNLKAKATPAPQRFSFEAS